MYKREWKADYPLEQELGVPSLLVRTQNGGTGKLKLSLQIQKGVVRVCGKSMSGVTSNNNNNYRIWAHTISWEKVLPRSCWWSVKG